jgi:hypothetical protein
MFRSAAAEATWGAYALIAGAERAAADARRFWLLGHVTQASEVWRPLKQCAIEKSDEVAAWLELLAFFYPNAVAPDLWEELLSLSPGYSHETHDVPLTAGITNAPGLNELIALNLGELRAAVHKLLLLSVWGIAIPLTEIRGEGVAEKLLDGGLKCIALTAGMIEPELASMSHREIDDCFSAALRQSIRDTSEESIDFAYHKRFGTYP